MSLLDLGAGDAVLFIQTGLGADELLPLAREPALAGRRRLLPHRRGYTGTGPELPGSIVRDAADCVALVESLHLPAVDVVGYSYSAAVALAVAAQTPSMVRSITLIEPPPLITSHRDEFVAVCADLMSVSAELGPTAALEAFWDRTTTPDWWSALERHVPDARAQMRRDASTFFEQDLPALLGWTFTADDARRIATPVLHVGAAESGPWWAEVRTTVLAWFPGATDVVVPGADHGLVVTHPADVAGAIADFLS
ncbi:alpha/beta hydrolase [Nocardioides sp. WS12]|uniref:alpha/beta fold hydrolase n=1 Tax=Nocardioides sp. WS12 TaxID=2486272 RepID=UPI0015FDAE18|nr:alpha/beta hydrolase [Nocardioides sp. WS12]